MLIFTAQQTLEEAQAFYKKVKQKAVEYGRSPDDMKIMPGVSPYIGNTIEEAFCKIPAAPRFDHS